MKFSFKRTNTVCGWIAGAIAAIVYLLTIEPTVSFWDCGEFISTAFKLEVGHPPGAPFFMLIARLFTLLAGSDVSKVAIMVNSFSALCSGLTITFLFWTITHLCRHLVHDTDTLANQLVVIISGLLGALAYTFSDTFWFSAVEGEVYAFSSLFTAIVFWAILRWEEEADKPLANRWIVLIAYLMGLSIGVHLLNLLAIPAIVLIYYFKKYTPSIKGTLIALGLSALILLVILYVIIPGVVSIATAFELFFVNLLGFPFGSGVLVYGLLMVLILVFLLLHTLKKGKVLANTIILCLTVILIGYGTYACTIIRSNAEPPMDQNNPEDLLSLQYYLNREQYGDRPLFSGPYYNAPPTEIVEGKKLYAKTEDQYEVTGTKLSYGYDPRFTTIFPRMYSRDSKHIAVYEEWGKVKGHPIKISQSGKQETLYCPTFGENLRFFFTYQLGHMYFRYFMWNFAGRQNDIQADGGPLSGNWLSGIKPLDEMRLGPQDVPQAMQNKAHNVYYCLPLIFGLLGFFIQYKRKNTDFWVVTTLFVLTGIAIVVYLNQTPMQPRERDYAYAGSFYAFSIWIGLGFVALFHFLPKVMKEWKILSLVGIVCLLLVPGIMAGANWNDHDRSHRYIVRDIGANYLNTCDQNAILFTNGDNDTFPLWYAQEVEGIRTDVRVVNLSYLSADWYIDQMQRASYQSEPLPVGMTHDQYKSGVRDAVLVVDRFKGDTIPLKQALDFMLSDDPQTKTLPSSRETTTYIPAKQVYLPVDKAKILSNGTVPEYDSNRIVPQLEWTLQGESSYGNERVYKNSLVVLTLLANNNWERPIYFTVTSSRSQFRDLSKYLRLDGMGYRIVPVEAPSRSDTQIGDIDTEVLYNRLMKYTWGNAADPKTYLEENTSQMLTHFRTIYARLAEALVAENKNDKAVEVLDYMMQQVPYEAVPLNAYSLPIINQYYAAGAYDQANYYAERAYRDAMETYDYLQRFPTKFKASLSRSVQECSYVIQQLNTWAIKYAHSTQSDLYKRINKGE